MTTQLFDPLHIDVNPHPIMVRSLEPQASGSGETVSPATPKTKKRKAQSDAASAAGSAPRTAKVKPIPTGVFDLQYIRVVTRGTVYAIS
jgi:hypothetical protein